MFGDVLLMMDVGWRCSPRHKIYIQYQKTAFQPDLKSSSFVKPMSTENHDILKHLKGKSPKMIIESLKTKQQTDENIDLGTMLDENNIL